MFYLSNPERGPLLYALVVARRPSAIIEFGTGRGYGSLCMAMALVDHGIDARVYTIDLVPHTQAFDWILRDEAGPRIERWSRAAFWAEHLPREVVDRVVPLEGKSPEVVARWDAERLPKIDLAFVDGGHDHRTARHDLLAACALARPGAGIVADDVVERPGFGVARALAELFPSEVIVRIPATWGPGTPAGAMAWIDLHGQDRLRADLANAYRKRRSWWRRILG